MDRWAMFLEQTMPSTISQSERTPPGTRLICTYLMKKANEAE